MSEDGDADESEIADTVEDSTEELPEGEAETV